MAQRRKNVLFVDDDLKLLEIIRQFMTHLAGEAWEVFTAPGVSQALALMQEQRIDLLVIDIQMPVVDGLQFLCLLQRKYPNVLKVVLTGDATEDCRAKCLSNGAELFLEKPRDEGGWRSVHATLHELAKFQPEEGFRGVLRKVGLPDVLQMECLARHSVVLSIRGSNIQGHVYVKDGQIIHAQCGARAGEEAFHHLMTLAGGEFDVQTYVEPPERSLTGSWEFLLMEAARKRDEATESPPVTTPDAVVPDSAPASQVVERQTATVVPVIEATPPSAAEESRAGATAPIETWRPRIEELLVCTLQGEVLHEWKCANPNARIGLVEHLSSQAQQLAQGLPLGEFDRIEASDAQGRVVVQIEADRALVVRVTRAPREGEAASFGA